MRQREAAQTRRHRIGAGGLGVERDDADILGAQHPGIQAVEGAHGLVFAAVELAGLRGGQMGRGQGGRREVCALLGLGAGLRRRREQIAALAVRDRSLAARRRAWSAAVAVARSLARRQLAVRLDLVGVDAGLLGDAARQRAEFHRLEEGDELLVVRLVHREVFDRHLELDIWSSVTSRLEMRAISALSISVWRRLSCLISPARPAAFPDRRIR